MRRVLRRYVSAGGAGRGGAGARGVGRGGARCDGAGCSRARAAVLVPAVLAAELRKKC